MVDDGEQPDPATLLETLVARHNEARVTDDWKPLANLLSPDCHLHFVRMRDNASVRGREAISVYLQGAPLPDILSIEKPIRRRAFAAEAAFRWSDNSAGGTVRIEINRDTAAVAAVFFRAP